MNLPRNGIRHGGDVTPKHVHHDGNNVPIRPHRGNSRAWTLDRLKRSPRGVAQCRRSHRCASASQTQSVNNRFRSGEVWIAVAVESPSVRNRPRRPYTLWHLAISKVR